MNQLPNEYLLLSYSKAKKIEGIDQAFLKLLEDEIRKRNLMERDNYSYEINTKAAPRI